MIDMHSGLHVVPNSASVHSVNAIAEHTRGAAAGGADLSAAKTHLRKQQLADGHTCTAQGGDAAPIS